MKLASFLGNREMILFVIFKVELCQEKELTNPAEVTTRQFLPKRDNIVSLFC